MELDPLDEPVDTAAWMAAEVCAKVCMQVSVCVPVFVDDESNLVSDVQFRKKGFAYRVSSADPRLWIR